MGFDDLIRQEKERRAQAAQRQADLDRQQAAVRMQEVNALEEQRRRIQRAAKIITHELKARGVDVQHEYRWIDDETARGLFRKNVGQPLVSGWTLVYVEGSREGSYTGSWVPLVHAVVLSISGEIVFLDGELREVSPSSSRVIGCGLYRIVSETRKSPAMSLQDIDFADQKWCPQWTTLEIIEKMLAGLAIDHELDPRLFSN